MHPGFFYVRNIRRYGWKRKKGRAGEAGLG